MEISEEMYLAAIAIAFKGGRESFAKDVVNASQHFSPYRELEEQIVRGKIDALIKEELKKEVK